MPEPTEKDVSRLDEELAGFTDQILSGKQGSPGEPARHDPELARLEQTILRMNAAFGPPEKPPQETAERIRQRLAQEWQRTPALHSPSPQEDTAPPNTWLARLLRLFGWDSARRRQRTLTLAFSSIAAVALLAALLLAPGGNTAQPAAAGRVPGLLVFTFFAAAALVAFFWDARRKP